MWDELAQGAIGAIVRWRPAFRGGPLLPTYCVEALLIGTGSRRELKCRSRGGDSTMR
jgi:hypothetical protein